MGADVEKDIGAQRWDRTTDTRIFSPCLYFKNLIKQGICDMPVHTTVHNKDLLEYVSS